MGRGEDLKRPFHLEMPMPCVTNSEAYDTGLQAVKEFAKPERKREK